MAQRSTLELIAIGGLLTHRTQSEEPWAVPFRTRYREGGLGEAGEGLAGMSKSICRHGDPIRLAIPGSHQFGPRLDPLRQLKSAGGLGRSGFHHLAKQPSGRHGKAAVGLLLNRVSNAATEEVRTE